MTIKKINLKILALLSLLSIFLLSACTDKPYLDIQNAWIAEAPPVSKVMVAYLTISNETSEQIEIVRAESDLYSSIEFHETVHENGMARMIRHQSLIIPSKSKLILQRGEKHLMLFNPKKTLKANDSVKITFTLSDNSSQSVNINVKKAEL